MIDTCVDRAMEKWAKEQREKIPARIRRLIAMASFNLWYGPLPGGYTEETGYGRKGNTRWPGFTSACEQIRNALENIHTGDVWVDIQCECVSTSEPQGMMVENPDYDPDDPESEEEVWEQPFWEDICHLDGREVLTYLVKDKELVPYVC